MELFDLLVTGQTKNKLLKVLWKEGAQASANQLSLMTESAYSTTHDELEQFVKYGMVLKETKGRSQMYSKNPNFKEAAALDSLLEVTTGKEKPELVSDDDVLNNLGNYGAPLGNFDEPKNKLSLEETLARAALLSQKNATVARVLPVGLWLNNETMDFKKLHYFSQKLNVTRAMGFYLELTGYLSENKKFYRESRKYTDKRYKKPSSFFLKASQSKYSKLLEEQNTPELSKKWKFTMNMNLDSFASMFDKFASQNG